MKHKDNARQIPLTEDDRRLIGFWAADCAERVLPLFETKSPADTRPREAIAAIRLYAHGGKRSAQLRSIAVAALAAAREVNDPSATAAAQAAGYAASTAYTKALAAPHHAKHALEPAVYATLTRELATGEASTADEELRWAIVHASPAVREIISRWLPASPAALG